MGILANMTREVKMVSKGEVNYTFRLQMFFFFNTLQVCFLPATLSVLHVCSVDIRAYVFPALDSVANKLH